LNDFFKNPPKASSLDILILFKDILPDLGGVITLFLCLLLLSEI
jgi:hypothetical protein